MWTVSQSRSSTSSFQSEDDVFSSGTVSMGSCSQCRAFQPAVDSLQWPGTTALCGNAAIGKNFAEGLVRTSSCSCCLVDGLMTVWSISCSLGAPASFKRYTLPFRLLRPLNPLRCLNQKLWFLQDSTETVVPRVDLDLVRQVHQWYRISLRFLEYWLMAGQQVRKTAGH